MDSIPKPVPADGEAIVKIKAFGLNRMDLLQREGLYPLPPQAPETMGVEFSGTVEEFGGQAHEDFKVGDEVLGLAYGGKCILARIPIFTYNFSLSQLSKTRQC